MDISTFYFNSDIQHKVLRRGECSGDAYFYFKVISLGSWIECAVVIDNRYYLLGSGLIRAYSEIFSESVLSFSPQTCRSLSPIRLILYFQLQSRNHLSGKYYRNIHYIPFFVLFVELCCKIPLDKLLLYLNKLQLYYPLFMFCFFLNLSIS